jgi:hypothetical protein
MAAGYILCLGLAYIYAIGNIALVVGLSPRDIAIHYYGAENVIKAEQTQQASGEAEFSLDDVGSEASAAEEAPKFGPRPSFKNLVQAGHFHLYGMTSFFFGLTLLALFTSLAEPWKTVFIGLPYIAIALDNLSFMATRFLGPQFSYLTAVSGAFMGICFTILWIAIGYELTRKADAK